MSDEGQDIFYVHEKSLTEAKGKVAKGEDIPEALVDRLCKATECDDIGDDEMMIPVDMSGVGEDFEDIDQMVAKLGSKGTCEAFVKAKECFDKNKPKLPEDECPQPMTKKEWQDVLQEDGGELGFEEEFFEGEEEEDAEDDEDEPEAKKARTA